MVAGCSRVDDERYGSGVCEVHKVRMQTEVVPNCNGFIDPTRNYGEARRKLFPNAGIDYGPQFYGEGRIKIYICSACVKARDEYIWNRERKRP